MTVLSNGQGGLSAREAINDKFEEIGNLRRDVPTLLADTDLTYTASQPGTVAVGDIVRTRAEGFSYEVADASATDHHVTTAGGVKLYVLPIGDLCRAAQFGITPTATNLGQKISDAIKAAAAISNGLVFSIPGTYTIAGKVTANDRISADGINGFRLEIPEGVRIESTFDILNEGVTNLFGFYDCNDITVTGGGEVEVIVADSPPISRVTFAVFIFQNTVSGPDNLRLLKPLRLKLRGADTFTPDGNYAGYVIRMNSAQDPAPQPVGFICDGVDFSGSSGRIIQTQGALGARIVNNLLEDIGADFNTVGIRSLGDASKQIIANNRIKSVTGANSLVSCITVGTLNVGRYSPAVGTFIEGNSLEFYDPTGTVRGIFLNGSENTAIRNNVFKADVSQNSRGIDIQLLADEIANGVTDLENVIVEGNTFFGVNDPLVIISAPSGGSISGVKYKGNSETNIGDVSSTTLQNCEIFEYQDGSFRRGEIVSAAAGVDIDVSTFFGQDNYIIEIEGITLSAFGTLNVLLQTSAGVSAAALNYGLHKYNLSLGTITEEVATSASAFPVEQVSTGSSQGTSIKIEVRTRDGRAFGEFSANNPVRALFGKWGNDDQVQRLRRVRLERSGGGNITGLKWRVFKLSLSY
jgi:hypothetical protein